MNDLTVKALLEQLGFPSTQSDLDESLEWALVELALRRAEEFRLLDRQAAQFHHRAITCRECRCVWIWNFLPLPYCHKCRPDVHEQAESSRVEFNAAF